MLGWRGHAVGFLVGVGFGALVALSFLLAMPCPTEDANLCTWCAGIQGNGVGASFTAISDELVVFW